MDIERMKAAFEYYRDDPLCLTNQFNIIATMFRYIAENALPLQEPELPDEPYIPLMKFYDETHICHPNYIGRLALDDKNFEKKCMKRNGTKWLVKKMAACHYLSKMHVKMVSRKAQEYLKKHSSMTCAPSIQKLLIT
jgi:hypothetical protein